MCEYGQRLICNEGAKLSEDGMRVEFQALKKMEFVRHGFSTRFGGVSQGIFASMNLATGRGDDPGNVAENFQRFCAGLGVNDQDLVFSYQTHDTNIRVVNEEDKGKGLVKKRDYNSVDGLVTNVSGVPLLTSYADCVPLFFADPVQKVVGLAHAGWRGTVKKIGAKMIDLFCEQYESAVGDIVVCIGPSIGQCCFQVGSEVRDAFIQMGTDISAWIKPWPDAERKYAIDLWQINQSVLLEKGVKKDNITIAGMCTRCNSDVFFSHRATNGQRGAMAAVIGIQTEGWL